jgi:arylesterase/paraoxonase
MVGGVGWAVLAANAGQFKTLEPVSAGRCAGVTGAAGAEDLTIDRQHSVALVSSTDRRALAAGSDVRGAIFAYDLRSRALRDLTAGFSGEFRPHGLSLYRGREGTRLFVVNHTTAGHSIEIFDWDGLELDHLETVESELLVSPNDVVGVGLRQFYATNDHASVGGPSRILEEFLRLRRSTVVFFDGEKVSVAAQDIAYANGINVSPNGREIFVASTSRGTLHLYTRNVQSGDLHPNTTIELGTGLDNIEVDSHGMLWIGAHPKLLSFLAHAGDEESLSPSQVLWVDPDVGFDPPVRDAFLDLGEDLSGSSVAAPWGSRLLIGSVFEEHFLDCERDPDA